MSVNFMSRVFVSCNFISLVTLAYWLFISSFECDNIECVTLISTDSFGNWVSYQNEAQCFVRQRILHRAMRWFQNFLLLKFICNLLKSDTTNLFNRKVNFWAEKLRKLLKSLFVASKRRETSRPWSVFLLISHHLYCIKFFHRRFMMHFNIKALSFSRHETSSTFST